MKNTEEATGNESGRAGGHGRPFPGSSWEEKSCNI